MKKILTYIPHFLLIAYVCFAFFKQDLFLLGATAIEDKLQEVTM